MEVSEKICRMSDESINSSCFLIYTILTNYFLYFRDKLNTNQAAMLVNQLTNYTEFRCGGSAGKLLL